MVGCFKRTPSPGNTRCPKEVYSTRNRKQPEDRDRNPHKQRPGRKLTVTTIVYHRFHRTNSFVSTVRSSPRSFDTARVKDKTVYDSTPVVRTTRQCRTAPSRYAALSPRRTTKEYSTPQSGEWENFVEQNGGHNEDLRSRSYVRNTAPPQTEIPLSHARVSSVLELRGNTSP